MCGRFANNISPDELLSYFGLDKQALLLEARYNIAPSQDVAVIRLQEGKRTLSFLRWGLVPHWAKDVKIGYKMINARAETLASKPSFRSAFRTRRCIIPASGFYEWKKSGASKQPYYIYRKDGAPMALAGLWEQWEDPEKPGEVVESCTIITTEANAQVAELHNRMPAMLEREDFGLWLDSEQQSPKDLLPLLRPAREGILVLRPVSGYVNKPGNEGEDAIKELFRGGG